MLFYLVSEKHCYTLHPFLTHWARNFQQRLKVITYPSLFLQRHILPGTYIFSDIERLTPAETQHCDLIYDIIDRTPGFQAINHPRHSMRRYNLLRTLYDRGINSFNIYRMNESQSAVMCPAFIRWENRHSRPLTPLLHSAKELTESVEIFRDHTDEKVIVEFCNTADEQDIYRKYSAYFVNGQVIPIHIMYSKDWFVKSSSLASATTDTEEWSYLRDNPHREQIKSIFQIARIDYGRIDYGMLDGRLQVWEINTNPFLMPLRRTMSRLERKNYFLQQFTTALVTLDQRCTNTEAQPFPMPSVITDNAQGRVALRSLFQNLKNWYRYTTFSRAPLTQFVRHCMIGIYGILLRATRGGRVE